MPRARTLALALCVAVGAALAAPVRAVAQPVAVTLEASPATVAPGQRVELTATIDPPAGGEPVSILDAAGAVVAQGPTGPAGRFVATFRPRNDVVLHAAWGTLVSPPVEIRVSDGVALTVRSGPVRLFDTLRAHGRTRPAAPGATVKLQLQRSGRTVATRNATVGSAGRFAAAFRIARPGRYRVRALLDGATATSPARATLLPELDEGARGVYVELLERRLADLRYRLTGIDGAFDHRTADAVMAFRKVQRMPRTTTVTAAVWRALADPKRIAPRSRADGLHVEIDQTRQVLAVVVDGKVDAIVHVSTGKASTPTYDGTFHVFSKLAGFSPRRLYYPSFFHGERAIHGWTEVPPYPASHGCVRVSYWVATWIFDLAPVGTTVIVHH